MMSNEPHVFDEGEKVADLPPLHTYSFTYYLGKQVPWQRGQLDVVTSSEGAAWNRFALYVLNMDLAGMVHEVNVYDAGEYHAQEGSDDDK